MNSAFIGKNEKWAIAAVNIFTIYSIIRILDIVKNESLVITKRKDRMPRLVRTIYIFTIMIIAVIVVLQVNLGVNLTAIVTTSAVLSMVLGLALQDTLTNLIAGIVLHSERSVKIGDVIRINDVEGIVLEMSWRAVKIKNIHINGVVYIPNSVIVKQDAVNLSYLKEEMIKVEIGCAYHDSPNKISKVLIECAKKHSEVLKEPHPEVRIASYGDFAINYELRAWIEKYDMKKRVESDLYKDLWYAFHRSDIKVPFPVREMHNSASDHLKDIDNEKRYILKKIDLFKDFGEEEMTELVHQAKLTIYGRNEKIFTEGDPGDSFFVIYSGKVNILRNGDVVAGLRKGDFFGEMSLLTGNKRSATAIADEESEILVIDKAGFTRVIMVNETLIHQISEVIAVREYENEIRDTIKRDSISEKEKNNLKSRQNSMFEKIKKFLEL